MAAFLLELTLNRIKRSTTFEEEGGEEKFGVHCTREETKKIYFAGDSRKFMNCSI